MNKRILHQMNLQTAAADVRIRIQKSCTPLIRHKIQIMDGQPEVGSPKTSVLAMITTIIKKASAQNKMPRTEAKASGAVENAMIPSSE